MVSSVFRTVTNSLIFPVDLRDLGKQLESFSSDDFSALIKMLLHFKKQEETECKKEKQYLHSQRERVEFEGEICSVRDSLAAVDRDFKTRMDNVDRVISFLQEKKKWKS